MFVRKIIPITVVLLLSLSSAFSQQEPLTRQQFEQSGAWSVAKLTAAYMTDRSEYRPLSSLEKRGMDDFIAQFTDIKFYTTDSKHMLNEAYSFLKDGANYWDGNGLDVFVEYKWNYTVALRDSIYSVDVFTYKPKILGKKGFTRNRKACLKEMKTKFKEISQSSPETQKAEFVDVSEGGIKNEAKTTDSLYVENLVVKNTKKWPSSVRKPFVSIPIWVYWVVIFVLSLIIIILYHMLRKANDAYRRHDDRIQQLIEFNPNKEKYSEIQEALESENAFLNREIKKLKGEIRKLKLELKPGKD